MTRKGFNRKVSEDAFTRDPALTVMVQELLDIQMELRTAIGFMSDVVEDEEIRRKVVGRLNRAYLSQQVLRDMLDRRWYRE